VLEDLLTQLHAEHARLTVASNPGISFDQFVDLTLLIGLEQLSQRPAAELLALVEELEA